VAIYAAEKAMQLGAKVVAMNDSNGYIYHKSGINLDTIKLIKEVQRGRIYEYVKHHPDAVYTEGCKGIWTIPCDIALPCATQNELDGNDAAMLVKNGCFAVGEGANMPSTPEAIDVFLKNKVIFGPAKAANAGGVATSGLEMTQNSMRLSWSFEEVDSKLKGIMQNIYRNASEAAAEYGEPDNLVMGANIAGFMKIAAAMYAQGITY
jgi:glutamate dehydrogenase (NADP+)